jgi:hypothetical protein
MRFLFIDRVNQLEGLCVYNMHNIVEKHVNNIILPPVRSQGGSRATTEELKLINFKSPIQ